MICRLVGLFIRADWSRPLTTGVGSPPSVVPRSLRRHARPLIDGEKRLSTVLYPRSIP